MFILYTYFQKGARNLLLSYPNSSGDLVGVGGDLNLLIRADFREGDEDSNFSLFRVRRLTEWPGPLH